MNRSSLFVSPPFVLLRLSGLSADVLESQRAAVIAYRLQQHTDRQQAWASRIDPLLSDLFTVVKAMDAGKPQQQLQQLRRDLHNGRAVTHSKLETMRPFLNKALADSLFAYVQEGGDLTRYLTTTEHLYRQQALLARRAFQEAIDDASFGRGIAMSSLSLLRQRDTYQKKDPAKFCKDDYQIENGLLRYFTRTATKTTPFSTLTHVAMVSSQTDATVVETAAGVQSCVRLSVRVLGLLNELTRINRRLREQEPVLVNPSITITDGYLHYIRQHQEQVTCARLPISPALHWVVSARQRSLGYGSWVDNIRIRFRATPAEARQYIDKLLSLGLLNAAIPASPSDADWPLNLRDWLTKHYWLAPTFVNDLTRLLDALLATARTLATATAPQRAVLLQKAWDVLAERVARLPHPPSTDFWPLRPEELFFEDAIRPLAQAPAGVNDTTLIELTRDLMHHVSAAVLPTASPLATLFRALYDKTQTVPVVSFFEQYLSQPEVARPRATVPDSSRKLWESWAEQGRRGHTLHLRSEWLTPSSTTSTSEGVFWQAWTNRQGQTCAALHSEAGGFGRLYGRFLADFEPTCTETFRGLNQQAVGRVHLAEPTDGNYHNANLHPTLVGGAICTPGGHRPICPTKQTILLRDLFVRLGADGRELELWNRLTGQRVEVTDMGFQAARSKLYAFLCQFSANRSGGVDVFRSAINAWYARTCPGSGANRWPRIWLDNRLLIQRMTWHLPVGPATALPAHDDAFVFFRMTQHWQQENGLPDEVFVSLPHAPAPDDRKPQYIRFDNPLLIDLLRRLVRKAAQADHLMRVVEMRPHTSELPRVDGRPFAIEAVPQWYNSAAVNPADNALPTRESQHENYSLSMC